MAKYSFAKNSEIIALLRAQQDIKTKTMHMLPAKPSAAQNSSTRPRYMPQKYFIMAIIAHLLVVAGCSTPVTTQPRQVAVLTTPRVCSYADATILEAPPAWICGAPTSTPEASIVGLGKSAPSLLGGRMYQESQATRRARTQLLKNLRAEAQTKVLQYLGDPNTDASASVEQIVQSVIDSINRDSLFGSTTYRSLLGPDGWFYVLVGMDRDQVDKRIAQSIATSMEQEQDLWAEFAGQMRDADLLESAEQPES